MGVPSEKLSWEVYDIVRATEAIDRIQDGGGRFYHTDLASLKRCVQRLLIIISKEDDDETNVGC